MPETAAQSDTTSPPGVSAVTPGDDANLLGFDVGTRRVGVALANVRIGTGRPLAVLPARPFPWDRVAQWLEEWQPAYAVIGWPAPESAPDGREPAGESTVMRRARGLARELEERFGLSACFQDERLTSHAAHDRRHNGGRSPDGPIDAEAAAILLDDHLRTGHARATQSVAPR